MRRTRAGDRADPLTGSRPQRAPDYVLVGHLSRDLASEDACGRPGGSVVYAGLAAARMGRHVGVVTACGPDVEMPGPLRDAVMVKIPSDATTTFSLNQGPGGRSLRLLTRARDLRPDDVPAAWRGAPIMHLAPIAWEIPPSVVAAFGDGMVVATLQGWLRTCGNDGGIFSSPAAIGHLPLDRLDAAVLSTEDLGLDEAAHPRSISGAFEELCRRVPIVALTRGAAGSTLFVRGRAHDIEPYRARAVDATGAGDVYAGTFFVRLAETADPLVSARFASCAAAMSVEGVAWSSIPYREQVFERMRKPPWDG